MPMLILALLAPIGAWVHPIQCYGHGGDREPA